MRFGASSWGRRGIDSQKQPRERGMGRGHPGSRGAAQNTIVLGDRRCKTFWAHNYKHLNYRGARARGVGGAVLQAHHTCDQKPAMVQSRVHDKAFETKLPVRSLLFSFNAVFSLFSYPLEIILSPVRPPRPFTYLWPSYSPILPLPSCRMRIPHQAADHLPRLGARRWSACASAAIVPDPNGRGGRGENPGATVRPVATDTRVSEDNQQAFATNALSISGRVRCFSQEKVHKVRHATMSYRRRVFPSERRF